MGFLFKGVGRGVGRAVGRGVGSGVGRGVGGYQIFCWPSARSILIKESLVSIGHRPINSFLKIVVAG